MAGALGPGGAARARLATARRPANETRPPVWRRYTLIWRGRGRERVNRAPAHSGSRGSNFKHLRPGTWAPKFAGSRRPPEGHRRRQCLAGRGQFVVGSGVKHTHTHTHGPASGRIDKGARSDVSIFLAARPRDDTDDRPSRSRRAHALAGRDFRPAGRQPSRNAWRAASGAPRKGFAGGRPEVRGATGAWPGGLMSGGHAKRPRKWAGARAK